MTQRLETIRTTLPSELIQIVCRDSSTHTRGILCNRYWRGRLWGPLNFLVYMGLRHPRYANLPDVEHARKLLVNVSREALLVEWLPKHHVHENLNPQTGLGDDVSNSNPMYHWGALLTFLEIWESGRF